MLRRAFEKTVHRARARCLLHVTAARRVNRWPAHPIHLMAPRADARCALEKTSAFAGVVNEQDQLDPVVVEVIGTGTAVAFQLHGNILGPNGHFSVDHLPNRLCHRLRFGVRSVQIHFGNSSTHRIVSAMTSQKAKKNRRRQDTVDGAKNARQRPSSSFFLCLLRPLWRLAAFAWVASPSAHRSIKPSHLFGTLPGARLFWRSRQLGTRTIQLSR